MNDLAHLYLAGPDPYGRIGNLLGDFIKGPLSEYASCYSEGIVKGIKLHSRKKNRNEYPCSVPGCGEWQNIDRFGTQRAVPSNLSRPLPDGRDGSRSPSADQKDEIRQVLKVITSQQDKLGQSSHACQVIQPGSTIAQDR